MTDISIRQEKNIIDEYTALNDAGKHPVLARYNGKLIIYKKDCDSLIEKIKQFISTLFLQLSQLFGNHLSFPQIDSVKESVNKRYNDLCLKVLKDSKNPELEQLNGKVQEATNTLNSLTGQIQTAKDILTDQQAESTTLRTETQRLRDKKEVLGAEIAAWKKSLLALQQEFAALEEERKKKEANPLISRVEIHQTESIVDPVPAQACVPPVSLSGPSSLFTSVVSSQWPPISQSGLATKVLNSSKPAIVHRAPLPS